jgi:cytidylate kinase
MSVPIVCIDGPSGAGKGTISRLLAKQWKWHLLDSGALYRLAALHARQLGLAPDQAAAIAYAASKMEIVFDSDESGDERIWLMGEEVTSQVRSEAIGEAASQIAYLPELRAALLDKQRAFLQPPGLVADGRDMGTVVFPSAPLKIFLTASIEERAQRRYKQLKELGFDASLSHLVEAIKVRDQRDASRTNAPLRPAEDAIALDSTQLTVDQVLQAIQDLARERHLV